MNDLSELTVMGNVTADLEKKVGEKSGKEYLYFNLANNKGPKDSKRASFYQCWVFGNENCSKMIDAGVKKGSRIIVTGELEMTPYRKKDGTDAIAPKVTVHDWRYASGGKRSENADHTATETSASTTGSLPDDLPDDIPEFDCGDDGLPF